MWGWYYFIYNADQLEYTNYERSHSESCSNLFLEPTSTDQWSLWRDSNSLLTDIYRSRARLDNLKAMAPYVHWRQYITTFGNGTCIFQNNTKKNRMCRHYIEAGLMRTVTWIMRTLNITRAGTLHSEVIRAIPTVIYPTEIIDSLYLSVGVDISIYWPTISSYSHHYFNYYSVYYIT